jgi:hypothetical protein
VQDKPYRADVAHNRSVRRGRRAIGRSGTSSASPNRPALIRPVRAVPAEPVVELNPVEELPEDDYHEPLTLIFTSPRRCMEKRV